MVRFLGRNKSKKQSTSGNEFSNESSGIDEEFGLTNTSPITTSKTDEKLRRSSSSSWPKIPELALTTSHDAYTSFPVDIPSSPSLSSQALYNDTTFSESDRHHDHYNSNSNQRSRALSEENTQMPNTDTESESDTEINDDVPENKRSSGTIYNDNENSSKTLSQWNDQHSIGFPLEDPAVTKLAEETMDKDEAKDRHVRFHDHVAESAALVQRMLSLKSGQHSNQEDPLGTMMQNRYDSHRDEEGIELCSPHSDMGGGSVLASLMRLEAKRQDPSQMKRKKKRNSKVLLPDVSHFYFIFSNATIVRSIGEKKISPTETQQ